jgi:hypothetical protein
MSVWAGDVTRKSKLFARNQRAMREKINCSRFHICSHTLHPYKPSSDDEHFFLSDVSARNWDFKTQHYSKCKLTFLAAWCKYIYNIAINWRNVIKHLLILKVNGMLTRPLSRPRRQPIFDQFSVSQPPNILIAELAESPADLKKSVPSTKLKVLWRQKLSFGPWGH